MKAGALQAGGPLGLVLVAALALAVAGPLRAHPTWVLGSYCVAGLGWWWAVAQARRGAVSLRLAVAGAVLLRLIALAANAQTSDDVHRIAWEGAVVRAGFSPYAFAPDHPDLAGLAAQRPRLHATVNHRAVPAAYPPLVQAVGVLVDVAVGERDDPAAGARLIRVLFAALDLLLLLPLVLLLRRRGLPEGLSVAWGWSPLAAFEIAGSGHLEALALAFLVGALALAERARTRAGSAAAALLFGGAVLAKVLPILLLPWFLRGPRPAWRALVVGAVVGLGFAPFLLPELGLAGTERGVLRGLREYALRWEGGGLLHRFVEAAWALRWPPDLSWTDPRRLARATLAVAWCLWALRTWRRERDPARAALDLFGAWLLVTPVLHPWYALWAVPWLALRTSHAFAWLACAAPILFVPVVGWQRAGVWVEPAWSWPVIALPFALFLALDARRAHPRAPAP